MDYRNSMGSLGFGIAVALMFSVINGISTYVLKDGQTIAELTASKVGGQ